MDLADGLQQTLAGTVVQGLQPSQTKPGVQSLGNLNVIINKRNNA